MRIGVEIIIISKLILNRSDIVNLLENLVQTLDDMETLVKVFEIEPFDIYFLGGAACILGGYSIRATRDFDFVDQNYKSHMGRAFAILRDYDMLEYESTALSPGYKERSKKLDRFKAFNAYVLSPEDIIASKIIRLEPKDMQDIDILIEICDRDLLNRIINEILARNDLYSEKKDAFKEKLKIFKDLYYV